MAHSVELSSTINIFIRASPVGTCPWPLPRRGLRPLLIEDLSHLVLGALKGCQDVGAEVPGIGSAVSVDNVHNFVMIKSRLVGAFRTQGIVDVNQRGYRRFDRNLGIFRRADTGTNSW